MKKPQTIILCLGILSIGASFLQVRPISLPLSPQPRIEQPASLTVKPFSSSLRKKSYEWEKSLEMIYRSQRAVAISS